MYELLPVSRKGLRRRVRWLVPVLIIVPLQGWGASPVDQLLHALASYVRNPSYECDWRAWHQRDAKRLAGLHRKAARDLVVRWGDGGYATVRSGNLVQATVETYLAGPPTASIQVTGMPHIEVGDRLTIALVDLANVRWPVFCGHVFLSAATATRGLNIQAVQPRPGGASMRREFQEMRAADVVAQVVQEYGLQVDLQNLGGVMSQVIQREGDFDFIRRLAREQGADVYLNEHNRIVMRESDFVLPAWPAGPNGLANPSRKSRSWLNMRDSDVVAEIARELGRSASVDATETVHEQVRQDNETDYEFIYRLAERNDNEVYFEANQLVMRDEGQIGPPRHASPGRSTLPGRIAVEIAARNRLPIELHVGPEQPLVWPTRQVTDPALLFGTLLRAGYTLVPDRRTLRIQGSSAVGDFVDHLPLRVSFTATGNTLKFKRQFLGLNVLMANPERNAEEAVTAQIQRASSRYSRLEPRLSGQLSVDTTRIPKRTSQPVLLRSRLIAETVQQAMSALTEAYGEDPASRFLLSVGRDYQHTLVHMFRRLPDGQARLEAIRDSVVR